MSAFDKYEIYSMEENMSTAGLPSYEKYEPINKDKEGNTVFKPIGPLDDEDDRLKIALNLTKKVSKSKK